MVHTVVYLDILILVNIVVDTVLLWVTSRILRLQLRTLRTLSALFIAVAYGTLVCVPEFSFALNILFRIAAALLISYIAFGYPSLRGFIKNTAMFALVSCAYTGILMLCQQIPVFSDYIYINNGQIYYSLPVPCVMLALLGLCIGQMLVSRFLSGRVHTSQLSECSVTLAGRSVTFRCFTDTGNFLTDAITGRPVVIVDRQVLQKLTDIDSEGNFKYGSGSPMHTRVRLIPYRGADGSEGILNAFRPDDFICNGKKLNVLVAANRTPLDTDGTYSGIMPAIR